MQPERKLHNNRSNKENQHGPTDWVETYDVVDVDLCRPNSTVSGMRFDYESGALELSIRQNGQLEPCRATRDDEDGTHLLVYVGQRRLRAVRNLKEKFGTPSALKVIIDENDDISDEELIKRALAENMDENGERLPLSDLEKIFFCRNLLERFDKVKTEQILSSAGLGRSEGRKIVSLVDKFDKEKVERLHKIEAKSNFRFRIAHLDLLLQAEDIQTFYATASLAAFSQKPPEEIKTLRYGAAHFAKDIPWFKEIFPDFPAAKSDGGDDNEGEIQKQEENKKEVDTYGIEERENSDNDSASQSQEEHQTITTSSPVLLPEPVIILRCHYCRSVNPLKLRTGSPEFIFCDLKESGSIEQLAIGVDAVLYGERECAACHRSFWVTGSVLEGGRIVIKTSRSKIIDAPREEVLVRRVYWDQNSGGWMLYDESTRSKSKLENPPQRLKRDEDNSKKKVN